MIVLVRVDERLIHGQVAVGWRGAFDVTVFDVVDDEVAATKWERELVVSGVPEGTRGEVFSVAEAAERWERWRADAERRLVLFESVRTALDLLTKGIPLDEVNMGGLHRHPGRAEVLPYLYLDDEDVAACRRLCAAGVRLEARDVPSAGAVDLCSRLGS